MRYLHLFAGMGGSHLFADLVDPGAVSAGSVEIDADCQRILRAQRPSETIHGDIQEFHADGLDVDVVLSGFPCTDLSTSGEGRGLSKANGSKESHLFFEAVRVAVECRAPLMFLENVRGVLSNRDGESFEAVLRELQAQGYRRIAWTTTCASEVGAPHHRARVFMLAHRTGTAHVGAWQRPASWPVAGVVDGDLFVPVRRTLPRLEGRGFWPTPTANDGFHTTPRTHQVGVWHMVNEDAGHAWVRGGLSQPAPTVEFFEALMGWPTGWTAGVVGGAWHAREGRWPARRGQAPAAWEPPRLGPPKSSVDRWGHRVRALGNGWVPAQAAAAWDALLRGFADNPVPQAPRDRQLALL